MMRQVVLASHNAHKLEELRRIIGPLLPGIELIGYDGPDAVENGLSFEANALIKARAAAQHTGLPALADDSGIAVDVLAGCPGIFSARWAGSSRSDEANRELLLWQLSDIDDPNRGAAFVCAAALVMPRGVGGQGYVDEVSVDEVSVDEVVVRGEWRGNMLREAAGAGGFGYDPIFCPEGEGRSAAELTPAEKDANSHRRRAFTLLVPEIQRRVR